MCPVVTAHVDDLTGCLGSTESGFYHSLGCTDEGNDSTVSGFAGIDVEQLYAVDTLALVICLIMLMSRPSLKLGTHSMMGWLFIG